MRRRLLLLFLVLATVVVAQDDKYATNGEPNGFLWTGMPDLMKSAVTMGMQMGRSVVMVWMLRSESQCRELVNSDAKWPNLSNGGYAKEIDAFYDKDPANLKFPIHTAMLYVLMKITGTSDKDLEKFRTGVLQGMENIK
jgi:hypothetical protein